MCMNYVDYNAQRYNIFHWIRNNISIFNYSHFWNADFHKYGITFNVLVNFVLTRAFFNYVFR